MQKEQFGPISPEKEHMLEIYLSDPEGSLRRLVDTLQRYHDLAIAPYWPRIHEHLEADMIKRGQVLALGGVEALSPTCIPKRATAGAFSRWKNPTKLLSSRREGG